jgi:serine/threonine-protein kinase
MPLNDGEIFAGFRIVRLLGSGGMGEVYLVQHPRLPRRNALKVLPTDVSADAEYRARFNREADLASTLGHPHTVSVHDRGEYNGRIWISMDYVDGTDAAQLVGDRYPYGMPPDEAIEIILAIAGALDYAHEEGLLHRDVKPANILLATPRSGERRILLADFGIARRINEISGLTQTNMTVGSVAYAAPEQLRGEAVDGRADQYAVACTAYHLLAGVPPFDGTNPAVVIVHHLSSPPPNLSDKRPELARLDPPLAMAMAKNAADRYPSCTDFAQRPAARRARRARPGSEHRVREPAPGTRCGVTGGREHARVWQTMTGANGAPSWELEVDPPTGRSTENFML